MCLASTASDSAMRYVVVANTPEAVQSLMEFALPQSRQAVTANRAAQWGQTASVWKVSKGCAHWLHFQ
jgi:tRNA(Met) C34 N-acetyltransferase TmcA